jgi:hypothetical protein
MNETQILGIGISAWLTIIALIAGPILAVQIQKYLEGLKEKKGRKVQVFKDLMSTRAAGLAYQHVVALNLVGIEFQGKEYTAVVNAWKTYLDHLGSFPKDDEAMAKVWIEKKNDLLSDLLYEMGTSLGFNFDKVHIKKAGYIPKAYADQEEEQNFIRRSLVEVFLEEKAIPLKIVSFPVDPESVETQKQLQKSMVECYQGGKPFPVKIVQEKS